MIVAFTPSAVAFTDADDFLPTEPSEEKETSTSKLTSYSSTPIYTILTNGPINLPSVFNGTVVNLELPEFSIYTNPCPDASFVYRIIQQNG